MKFKLIFNTKREEDSLNNKYYLFILFMLSLLRVVYFSAVALLSKQTLIENISQYVQH